MPQATLGRCAKPRRPCGGIIDINRTDKVLHVIGHRDQHTRGRGAAQPSAATRPRDKREACDARVGVDAVAELLDAIHREQCGVPQHRQPAAFARTYLLSHHSA